MDSMGNVNSFLDRVHLTALKADKNDPSALLAGSARGTIRTLRNSEGEWNIVDRSGRDMSRGNIMDNRTVIWDTTGGC